MRKAILRLTIPAGLTGALLAVCLRFPNLHRATVALVLVVAIIALAATWGWLESLIGALIACVGFDYYFLPPRGLGLESFETMLDLMAFLFTAIVTGQLVARLKRHQMATEQGKNEIEKIHKLANATLRTGLGFSFTQLAKVVVEVFGADGVAIYDHHTGQIVRAGEAASAITDQALHETAAGHKPERADPAILLSAIWDGEKSIGSIGLSGNGLTQSLVHEIATQVGVGLFSLRSIQSQREAEAARRSDELKSAILDAVAHDIRNPLNSAKLAATTLLSGYGGGEQEKQEMLTIIDEELDRMDRLIDEAAKTVRVKAKELSFLKKQPQNVLRLVSGAIEEMGSLAGLHRIHVSAPESLPMVSCDGNSMRGVLRQLLSNGLKYAPDESPITVSAELRGAAVVIHVVDHGPGIAEEERDSIFDRYYRGLASSGTPGTGLGLSSARIVVEAHDGQIWITSPPAGGAAFHVSLPAAIAVSAVGAP